MEKEFPYIPPVQRNIRGRGTTINPAGRFDKIDIEIDREFLEVDDRPAIQTQYFRDSSKKIISFNDSPDIGMRASINPYRGCEHGCIYCYARPTHEYFELSSGLDFETKIFVKEDAPQLLRQELGKRSWEPQPLMMSGVTDPYQPVERKLKITRGCLEVLLQFRNPVGIITKNSLVARDIDLLKQLRDYQCCSVAVSVTTLDPSLKRVMEPRTSQPDDRLKTVAQLSQAGIPVGVMVAPVIPGLNDHEIHDILKAASQAGAQFAGYVMLRLPYAVKELFEGWLAEHFPDRKNKILNRIRSVRGGKLYDSSFGTRMRGEGVFARQIEQMFQVAWKKYGFAQKPRNTLSTEYFRSTTEKQLTLF